MTSRTNRENVLTSETKHLLLAYILAGVAGLYSPKVEEEETKLNVPSDTDLWYNTTDFIYLFENYHRW